MAQPVIPVNKLGKVELESWTLAKDSEDHFYRHKRPRIQTYQLPERIVLERLELLTEVYSTGLLSTFTVSRLAAAVDHVLLNNHRLMTVKDAVKAGMAVMTRSVDMDAVLDKLGWRFEVDTLVDMEDPVMLDLESFSTGRIYGVKDWLYYMFSLMSDEGRYYTFHDLERLDELVLHVTFAGTTAHMPPSRVAAAILIHHFGEDVVRDYTAGYRTPDVISPLQELIWENYDCVIKRAIRSGCPVRVRRRLFV